MLRSSARSRWNSIFIRSAAALTLLAGVEMLAGCSSGSNADDVDPASLGFQHYYRCANDADVVRIGQRDTAVQCLAACKSVSTALLGGAAKACWWLDGTAGRPRDCRLCKTTAPSKDIFLNDWAMSLPAPNK